MNKKLCTSLHLIYHLTFGSTMYIGANSYLDEMRKLRDTIETESNRLNSNVNNLKNGVDNTKKSFDNLSRVSKKIKDVCRF